MTPAASPMTPSTSHAARLTAGCAETGAASIVGTTEAGRAACTEFAIAAAVGAADGARDRSTDSATAVDFDGEGRGVDFTVAGAGGFAIGIGWTETHRFSQAIGTLV